MDGGAYHGRQPVSRRGLLGWFYPHPHTTRLTKPVVGTFHGESLRPPGSPSEEKRARARVDRPICAGVKSPSTHHAPPTLLHENRTPEISTDACNIFAGSTGIIFRARTGSHSLFHDHHTVNLAARNIFTWEVVWVARKKRARRCLYVLHLV